MHYLGFNLGFVHENMHFSLELFQPPKLFLNESIGSAQILRSFLLLLLLLCFALLEF